MLEVSDPFAQVYRWGANGLALAEARNLYFLRSNLIGGAIAAPQFTVSTLSPSPIPAGNGDFTLKIGGINFTPADIVSAGGTPVQSTFVSTTEIDATIPAALIVSPGSLPIAIATPAPASQTANLVLVIGPGGALAKFTPSELDFGTLLIGAS
jgi:hypothetical protein